MALRVKVLRTKAEKFEQKELLNSRINPKQMSTLDEMLHNVYANRRPKSSDYDVRRDLVRVFNEIAKELYGNSKEVPIVVEFGSFSMDIFNAKSDLDLSINFGNCALETSREKKIQTLRKFAKKFYALQSKGHVTGVLPITTAKVPIVKVVDCGTGVECDISVENRDGILKSQILNMISTIDERFRKLSFLMKAWAKAHNINSSKDKTLNSLSIVLLVAFHLQTRNPRILPPFSILLKDGCDPASVMKICSNFMNYGRGNKETLAELFVSLLIKLSAVEKLWPKGLCASAYEGCWASKTWDSKIGSISVEDFTDRSQNVARAVGISEVKIIYQCIQLSIRHVYSFMDGQIEGPMLMELLFGREAMPTLVGTGRGAMPSEGYGRTGQPNPSNSVLTKRTQPAGGWGGVPTGSWTRTPTEDYVQPHSTKRMRPAESWGQVHPGWGQTSTKEWAQKQQITEGWGGMRVEHFGGTQQPIAGGWVGRERTSSSLPIWTAERQPPGAWEALRNANALLAPTPTALLFVPHLQNHVPASLNFPSVHPAPSGPLLHRSFPEKKHWNSTSGRR